MEREEDLLGRMPVGWGGVTLAQYVEIDAIVRDEGTPPEVRQGKVLGVLTGESLDSLFRVKLPVYAALVARSGFLGIPAPKAAFSGRWVDAEGRAYIAESHFDDVTMAQFVDFCQYAKGMPDSLPELLSCFFRPEGAKGYLDGYRPKDVRDAVAGMPVPDALGAAAFFLARLTESAVPARQCSPRFLKGLSRKTKEQLAAVDAVERIRTIRTIKTGLEAILSRGSGVGRR